ncbi:MAG: hypothetical protein AABZ39_15885 [Spirochaetota bacterium]
MKANTGKGKRDIALCEKGHDDQPIPAVGEPKANKGLGEPAVGG